jgi:signal transduction histidine kinase
VSAISVCSLFNHLPAAQLEALEAAAVIKEFSPGGVVFREGDPGDGLYVILEGETRVSCLVGPNDRRVLSAFGPGEFVGEIAVIDAQPRSATLSAVTASKLALLPRDAVLRALAQSPMFAVNLVREMVHRTRDFNRVYTQEVVQAERLTLVGRFARSIVHDFKNPLNIIGISADMMAMGDATPDMRATARGRIRRQVDRLSNMISELLEFTRGGAAKVALSRVDYRQFVQPLLEEIRQEIETRRVELVCEADPPAVRVRMDPKRLSHVFHNLAHNACDAMPDGGTLTCTFRVTEQELVTEMRDTGPGIAPEIATRLFEAFATHGKASGTGLGLSICRRILDDHQGTIEAENAAEGGAVFRFALPLAD